MKNASNEVTKAILTYSVCSHQDSSGAILHSSFLFPICGQRIPSSQLRIDTIPVRGKASTVTVLRPMLLMETRIATGAMWLLFDMGSCRGIAFRLDKSVS